MSLEKKEVKVASGNGLDNLIYRLYEWRWPEALQGLLSDVMLVTDADIGKAFEDSYGKLKCRLVSTEEYSASYGAAKPAALPDTIQKLVFFCRTNELAHVKAAKRAFAGVDVYSGTYDFAPLGVYGGGYFEWNLPADVDSGKSPLVILAAPGSDVEFFCQLLGRNGLDEPRELINRTMAAWVAEVTDFQPLRFLQALNRQHGANGLQMILYMDVLLGLLENTNMSMSRFISILKQSGSNVMYFTRRDKCTQSAILPLMDKSLRRSVWTSTQKARDELVEKTPDPGEIDAWTTKLLKMEATFEAALDTLPAYKSATLEEVAESPAEVMDMIAVYLDVVTTSDVQWVLFEERYHALPKVMAAASDHRKRLVDRLGLYVNEYGSFSVSE